LTFLTFQPLVHFIDIFNLLTTCASFRYFYPLVYNIDIFNLLTTCA